MPINVSYQPAADVIQQQAYIGGLGQYYDRAAQRQMQQQQMAQQWAEQQQQLAVRMYEQQQYQLANQNSQLFHAQQQQVMQQRDQQNDLAKMQQQQQFLAGNQAAGDARQNAAAADRLKTEFEARAKEADARRLWEYSVATGEDERKSLDTYLGGIAKQLPQMSDVGKSRYNDLATKFQAISRFNDSGMMRPEQYAQQLQKFRGEVASANLESHITPTPSIQEQVESGSDAFQQPIYAPDGSFMGHNLWTRSVRNGAATLAAKFIPHKPPEETAMPASAEDYWKSLKPTEQNALYKASADELKDPLTDAAPSPDKVMAHVRKKLNVMHGFSDTVSPSAGQPAQQPPVTPVSNPPPAPPPQGPPPTMSGIGIGQGFPPGTPPEAIGQPQPRQANPDRAVKIADLPAPVKRDALAHLPRPVSREQRDSLPVGTQYIAPDGSIQVVRPLSYGVTGSW